VARYDAETGWTWMPEWLGYFRKVEGWSDDVYERLDDSDIDWYLDRRMSLVGRCDPARLSDVLAGEPLAPEEPVPENPRTQWLSHADLAMAVTRFTSDPSSALKMLRAAGLLVREDGKDVPTPAARGLYFERPMKTKYGRLRPGAMQQRLWAFEVVRRLVALPDEDKPINKLEHPETWKTGSEPMTEKQREYLEALCLDTEEPFDPSLSKAAASARIDELAPKPKVPMTPEQEDQLKKLCEEAGLFFNANLSKGAAAVKIEKLVERASQPAQSFDSGEQVKRARLTRDVLSALDSTHPKGTEVVLVQEFGATGFCLIEVALPHDRLEGGYRYVILEVEAAALEIL
jgi:hypothetical protein